MDEVDRYDAMCPPPKTHRLGLEIRTRRPEGRPMRWAAILTEGHPMHDSLRAGDSVALGDTEEALHAELTRLGYSPSDDGRWTYLLPVHLRGPGVRRS